MSEQPKADYYIEAITALGPTHGIRAKKYGVTKRTIERIVTDKHIPECVTRIIPHLTVAQALLQDALIYAAEHPSKTNDHPT